MANTAFTVKFYNKGLVEAYSKIRVDFFCKVYNGVSMFINSIASAAELEVMKK